MGVTGDGSWLVGASWDPLGGAGASFHWWGGLGLERLMVWAGGALGVEGAGRPSSPTSMAYPNLMPFNFIRFFFLYHTSIVFRYKKGHPALVMEKTKPIKQNKITKETISSFLLGS